MLRKTFQRYNCLAEPSIGIDSAVAIDWTHVLEDPRKLVELQTLEAPRVAWGGAAADSAACRRRSHSIHKLHTNTDSINGLSTGKACLSA